MRFGVVIFPGSNCEQDVIRATKYLGYDAEYIWHGDTDISGFDAIVLPGGFSYGDYIRTGAVARFSPVMAEVVRFAEKGGPVLGICNGFQILCESHLLPGALIRNDRRTFVCRDQLLRVESTDTVWTCDFEAGDEIVIALKNGEGNFQADAETVRRLEGENRVVFRYLDVNPNGSINDIAGITNQRGNVVGLMPHPEHAIEKGYGPSLDGLKFFTSVLKSVVSS